MGCVYYVRHGQTIWNVENRICGASDIALTSLGHEQAIEAGRKIAEMGIEADGIICSPLIRARDTALHISEVTGIPMWEDERLAEQHFGEFESTARRGAEFLASKQRFADSYKGGESMMRLAQRVYNLLDEIKSSGKTYILVAHNGIARSVHSYFNDMTNEEYADYGIGNCEIVRYDWSDTEDAHVIHGRYNEPSDSGKDIYGIEKKAADHIKKIKADGPEAKTYGFYGWEKALCPALIDDYPGITSPIDLYEALSHIWCRATCAPRMQDDWTQENMTLGQCSITAFLAQDIFGGKVFGILRPGGNYHCYNDAAGCRFDLTSEQFGEEKLDYEDNSEQFKEIHFAKEEKRQRYEYLKEALRKYTHCGII